MDKALTRDEAYENGKNRFTESDQYLTFMLGGETFALEISKVQEVMDYTIPTKVPRMPEHLSGVINLRGNIVSLVNLPLILGMESVRQTVDTCIVIVEVCAENGNIRMGVLADSVQEVVYINPAKIEPPPKVGAKLNTDYIKGVGKKENSFLIILDIDKVLSSEELARIAPRSEW